MGVVSGRSLRSRNLMYFVVTGNDVTIFFYLGF